MGGGVVWRACFYWIVTSNRYVITVSFEIYTVSGICKHILYREIFLEDACF
jgi:hypothetical protein